MISESGLKEEARKTIARTTQMILMKAVYDLFGQSVRVWIEFNYRGNYYIRLEGAEATEELGQKILERMKELTKEALPIEKKTAKTADTVKILYEYGYAEAAHSLQYRSSSRVNYHQLGEFTAYFAGTLMKNTAEIKAFDLKFVGDGFLLVLPSIENPESLNPVVPMGKFFATQKLSQTWADGLGISSITDLNDVICAGKMDETILMQEAIYEKHIGDVAQRIFTEQKKFVFLAGPSSSGKTTTAYRLAIQLKAYGYDPKVISADDYFFGVDERPLLPNGKPDLESIRAVDTELFNRDMLKLLNGEEIELPSYNFVLQKREYKGKKICLGEKKILIVEGIHCLNPLFSEKIPEAEKFLIYVSALSPLCVDSGNPVPTSDCRLLRRIIRDHRRRGYSAAQTISNWSSVREGEEVNIFAYQENADEIINSAMIYELAVLKMYAEPLLFGIGMDEPEYREARRLIKFLSFVLAIPQIMIPATSVIREFIGGSYFDD